MTSSEQRSGGRPAGPSVPALAREVEEFVAAGGWDGPPQLFALVSTRELLAQQPELADQLDVTSSLTPVAQEALPDGDLGDALATIAWPDAVLGCALSQEIIVLPPGAETELPPADGPGDDVQRLRRAAADHPSRTEARLVAAVLREGGAACVMRLRGIGESEGQPVDEIIENPELAPNLIEALRTTLTP